MTSTPNIRLSEWIEHEKIGSDAMWQYDPRPDIERLLEQLETLRKATSEALPLLEALANPHSLTGEEDQEIVALRAALNPTPDPSSAGTDQPASVRAGSPSDAATDPAESSPAKSP